MVVGVVCNLRLSKFVPELAPGSVKLAFDTNARRCESHFEQRQHAKVRLENGWCWRWNALFVELGVQCVLECSAAGK